jgi:hypothetical protein
LSATNEPAIPIVIVYSCCHIGHQDYGNAHSALLRMTGVKHEEVHEHRVSPLIAMIDKLWFAARHGWKR